MSDSVDRVFVHALATVRRLPRTGSSRPPPSSRLRLYGLYKQSMEGDVAAILPRPTLPVASPDPNSNTTSAVHRYASRDLRTREAQAEIEKWDAWHACAGMSRTEAKRQYISTLIDTMKEYASGTAESRELVGELEFVWNQISSQSGSGSDPSHSSGSPSGKGGRKGKQRREGEADVDAERESLGLERTQSMINSMSFGSKRASVGSGDAADERNRERGQQQHTSRQTQRPTRIKRTESGLRVLSPISQRDSDSLVEPVDADPDERDEQQNNDDDDDDDNENLNTAPTSPQAARHPKTQPSLQPQHDPDLDDNEGDMTPWQATLTQALSTLRTEIAALREQLSANHLLSSSTYSHTYYALSQRQRLLHRAKLYVRTVGALVLKQLAVQLGLAVVIMLWGRVRGDLRFEEWFRETVRRSWKWLREGVGGVLFWVLDLFGRDGRLGFLGRVLRVF